MFDKVGSQPVEKLGVSRFLPLGSKVIGISGDGIHKVMLPDSVHNGSGRQWVVWIGNPARDFQTSAR